MTVPTSALGMLDQIVGPVVAALSVASPDLPELMVVGAVCRDFLHRAAGHDPSRLRRTDDLDIAVAVSGWDHYERLVGALQEVGRSSRIRYRVAGVTVDLVPFGEPIESPDGVVAPARRSRDPMSVFGFQDVWATARLIRLAGTGPTVRMPTVPGYTALKLRAWADRSSSGQLKDAGDLATAVSWYRHDTERVDWLYASPAGNDLLVLSEMDVSEAMVRLLVQDALAVLAPERRRELSAVWASVDDRLLADSLAHPSLPGWPRRDDGRLSRYVRAIRSTLAAGVPAPHAR